MLVRKLQAQDVARVEQIFDKYWNDDFRANLSDKVSRYIAHDEELQNHNFQMHVLEDGGDVAAVSAMRDAPEHMAKYARMSNPVEFYVLAVQEQNQGYGSILTKERMRVAQEMGYTEAVFFSGETHQDSWDFHDAYAERVSDMAAPNGEEGYVWSVLFDDEETDDLAIELAKRRQEIEDGNYVTHEEMMKEFSIDTNK